MEFPPDFACPQGEDVLDACIKGIREAWRDGKQISLLIGAGFSLQSGFPALAPLAEHLLRLVALSRTEINLGFFKCKAYDLIRDGWIPAATLHDLLSVEEFDFVQKCIVSSIQSEDVASISIKANNPGRDNTMPIHDFVKLASNSFGLTWFRMIEELAAFRPEQVDTLFDAISTNALPGSAHAMLAQIINWLNIRLILTTNFDSLIERTLSLEGFDPKVYDVHIAAPPPDSAIVNRHLSVIKLHGGGYGLRANTTIHEPLDLGHRDRISQYFKKDSLLIILDFGGNDRRIMDLLDHIITERRVEVWRVDALALTAGSKFERLNSRSGPSVRFESMFYPQSRFFLLELYQRLAQKLPNTRIHYAAIPHSPAPLEISYLGFGSHQSAAKPDVSRSKRQQRVFEPHTRSAILRALQAFDIDTGIKRKVNAGTNRTVLVAAGPEGCGVSQVLAQVSECMYLSHQTLWCDLDEATSVGTIAAWLYAQCMECQPELVTPPLPLIMPRLISSNNSMELDESEIRSLLQTAITIWDRIKRARLLVVLDSISYCLHELLKDADLRPDSKRLQSEAIRIVTFLSALICVADADHDSSSSKLLIGTHDLDTQGVECAKLLAAATVVGGLIPSEFNNSQINTNRFRAAVELLIGKAQLTYVDHSELIPVPKRESAKKYCSDFTSNSILNGMKFVPVDDLIATIKLKESWTLDDDIGFRLWILLECSWCNRPRSWAQIVSMRSVKALVKRSKPDTARDPTDDYREVVDQFLKWATDRKYLYRQQGAFYYMPGDLRTKLRELLSGTGTVAGSRQDHVNEHIERFIHDNSQTQHNQEPPMVQLHWRAMRYYDRAYNCSDDSSALTYLYWHAHQLILYNAIDVKEPILETARILLENVGSARGHLDRYDQACVLLRFVDLVDTKQDALSVESYRRLKAGIESSIAGLYEAAEDESTAVLTETEYSGASSPPPAGAGEKVVNQFVNLRQTLATLHERQKCLSRGFKMAGSAECGIKVCSLHLQLDLPKELSSIISLKAYSVWLSQFNKHREGNSTRANWISKFPTDDSAYTIHCAVLRLSRCLGRLAMFGAGDAGGVTQKDILNGIDDLLSAGIEALAKSPVTDYPKFKLLWVRYMCIRSQLGMYLLGTETLSNRANILRKLGLARSYAIRAGGTVGKTAEAVTGIFEAEALIWEARVLLAKRKNSGASVVEGEVRARQDAAGQLLINSLDGLKDSIASVAQWREAAILFAAVAVDRCKRSAVYLENEQLFSRDVLLSTAAVFLNCARQMKFLSSVCSIDPWRNIRFQYQSLRMVTYSHACIGYSLLELNKVNWVDGDTKESENIVMAIHDFAHVIYLLTGEKPRKSLFTSRNPSDSSVVATNEILFDGFSSSVTNAVKSICANMSRHCKTGWDGNSFNRPAFGDSSFVASELFPGSIDPALAVANRILISLYKHNKSIQEFCQEWVRFSQHCPENFRHGLY